MALRLRVLELFEEGVFDLVNDLNPPGLAVGEPVLVQALEVNETGRRRWNGAGGHLEPGMLAQIIRTREGETYVRSMAGVEYDYPHEVDTLQLARVKSFIGVTDLEVTREENPRTPEFGVVTGGTLTTFDVDDGIAAAGAMEVTNAVPTGEWFTTTTTTLRHQGNAREVENIPRARNVPPRVTTARIPPLVVRADPDDMRWALRDPNDDADTNNE